MFPRNGNDSFGSYVYEQAREMNKLGIDLTIVSPQMYIPKVLSVFGGKLKKYALASTEYKYREFNVIAPKCLWAKEILNGNMEFKYRIFKLSMYTYLKKCCEINKPDIIYSLDPLMDGRLCVEIGKILNIPVVLIEHSVPANYRNFVDNDRTKKIYKEVCEAAQRVIFVTNRQWRLYKELLDLNCHYKIILNGFRNENKITVGPHVMTKSSLKMVTIGFLEDRKGYVVLFKALKELLLCGELNFELTIIGDGYERERYDQIVKKYDLSEKVKFTGLIPHDEVFTILNTNDLFVLPSYEEAFGIAYLEAMSCGLPIVGTEDEGISDIITHGENGYLVKREDYTGLMKILLYIKNHPEQVNTVAQNGYETVKKYGWSRNAKEIIEVFNTIMFKESGD